MNTQKASGLNREQRLIGFAREITASKFIGDDCAVLENGVIVSSDMLVEGKHFLLPQMKLADLGWKAMACNISDIAAMAGKPEYALVSLALPASFSDQDFQSLYGGLQECCSRYNLEVVGGDLCSSEALVISITIWGRCQSPAPLLRSSACPGDLIITSGDFGASALGLRQILQGEDACAGKSYTLKRHLRPDPRCLEAHQILEALQKSSGANRRAALMDTSDGLADALMQIARASSLDLELEEALIPIAGQTRELAFKLGLDPIEAALYGGEDYELVATLSPETWEVLKIASNSFTAVGKVKEREQKRVEHNDDCLNAHSGGQAVLILRTGDEIKLSSEHVYQHWQNL